MAKTSIKPAPKFHLFLSSAPQVKLQAFVLFSMTGLCQSRADRNARSSQCPSPLGATRIFHLICGTCRAGSSHIHTSLYTPSGNHFKWRISQIEPEFARPRFTRNHTTDKTNSKKISSNELRLLFDSSISCILFCCGIYHPILHAFIAIGRFFYLSFSFIVGEVVTGTRALRLD